LAFGMKPIDPLEEAKEALHDYKLEINGEKELKGNQTAGLNET